MLPRRRHVSHAPYADVKGYAIAVLAASLALLPWLLLGTQIEPSPFLLFLTAVVVGAWLGGLGPGLLVTAVGAAAGVYTYTTHHDQSLPLQLGLFVLVALFVSYLTAALGEAEDHLREAGEQIDRQHVLTSAITRNLGEGVYALSRDGHITFVNRAAEEMLGWTEAELLGSNTSRFLPFYRLESEPILVEEFPGFRSLHLGSTTYADFDEYTRRDGTRFPVDYVASPIRTDGHVTGVVVAFRDITERKTFEEQLKHQALHDALTGLPNRVLFDDRLTQALLSAQREGCPVTLLLMDLDRFKDVNDTFGHHYGDLLLQEVGSRLCALLRESDTVARLGGDEFALLLPATGAASAILVAEKIHEALTGRFELEDQKLDVDASIGIALFPDHGADARTLLRRADVAMYAAKEAKQGYAVYTPERDPHSPSRLAIMGDLRLALEREELTLHFQPKINLKRREVDGVEALVRWLHPERGLLAPDHFIPLAEHTGLIKLLCIYVLEAAIRQCRLWHDAGLDTRIAVNLSARNLLDPHVVETVAELLHKYHVPPAYLQIEITESAVMTNRAHCARTLFELHSMGVRLSIDDFGTGYSSLAYLTELPVDELKIDKSFVLDMTSNSGDAFVARSVIDLGHNLGLHVVAEGVEDRETCDLLASMGCDCAQGYYLGRPLGADEYVQWLRQSPVLGHRFSVLGSGAPEARPPTKNRELITENRRLMTDDYQMRGTKM